VAVIIMTLKNFCIAVTLIWYYQFIW